MFVLGCWSFGCPYGACIFHSLLLVARLELPKVLRCAENLWLLGRAGLIGLGKSLLNVVLDLVNNLINIK